MADQKSYDYLPGTKIYLYQSLEMFRINTDTHLLGQFMVVHLNETVLDIGTNNGALLLYAAQYQPKTMVGVEIQSAACDIAQLNMQLHHFNNVTIINEDIKNYQHLPFDVIVCNPPYFKSHADATHGNLAKRIARQEIYLTIHQLIQQIQRFLKDVGRAYLVYSYQRFDEITTEIQQLGMYLKTVQLVYDDTAKRYHTVLLEIVKTPTKTVYQDDYILKR